MPNGFIISHTCNKIVEITVIEHDEAHYARKGIKTQPHFALNVSSIHVGLDLRSALMRHSDGAYNVAGENSSLARFFSALAGCVYIVSMTSIQNSNFASTGRGKKAAKECAVETLKNEINANDS